MPTKKPKLPAALKVGTYANVVAASADLIVAGCNSGGPMAGWSPESGTVVIDKPFGKLPFRAGPAIAGLTALPGGRFVQSTGATVDSNAKQHPGSLGIFGLDGALIGKARTGEFGACASSPAGDLVAVSTEEGLSLWRTDDLIAGSKPLRTYAKLELAALSFTPDGKSMVFLAYGKLAIVPVSGGSVVERTVKSSTQIAEVVSVSNSGVVCVSDQKNGALISLAGKTLCDWPAANPKGLAVELAMITPDDDVIAVAGALVAHYARDWAERVKLPDRKMADGFVAVLDTRGKLQHWKPRAKKKPARAMALSTGRAIAIGQDGGVELAPWPLS